MPARDCSSTNVEAAALSEKYGRAARDRASMDVEAGLYLRNTDELRTSRLRSRLYLRNTDIDIHSAIIEL
jgi:hypothetical protein